MSKSVSFLVGISLFSSLSFGSHKAAVDEEQTLDKKRVHEMAVYFLGQANIKGSKINAELADLTDKALPLSFPLSQKDVKIMQVSETVCGDPVYAQEDRDFLILVQFIDHQESNFDSEGNYRSNTAYVGSRVFRCSLSAESYGSIQVTFNCQNGSQDFLSAE